MDAMTTFCNNVMAVLNKKGWTIQDLATECQLDRSNLSKVLHGKEGCTLARAERIAEALDVPLSMLVDKSAKFFAKVS